MLLIANSHRRRRLSGGYAAALVGLFLLLLTGIACAQRARLPCVLEIPTYDATGKEMEFKVVAVAPLKDRNTDLLTTAGDQRMSASGSLVFFSEAALGRAIEVTLEGQKAARFKGRIELTSCRQRASLTYGQLDAGLDVAWSTVSGQLAGCALLGDWWIRAMPMHGGYESPSIFEGRIEPADGSFSLSGGMRGVRHILVIGKGRQPVKAFATDVTVSAKNTVGTVDLSGSCPN